ncbi:MAG: hypothetical protein KAR38_02750 [Calditrichia bacterium]|nr:hypothetical protein [Calditrichia bacterium]
MNWLEIFGYMGSVLIAASLMMKNILHLRRINLIGASTFAIYGLIVEAYPVFFLNAFIALTDVYYLIEMYRQKEYFSLMPVLDNRHKYLDKFYNFYKTDINKFFPKFNWDSIEGCSCFFILRNLMPVGLFIYKNISDEEIEIVLDYAIPDYRDLKNARFVYFAQSRHFQEKGIKKLISKSCVKSHRKYLKNIGFKADNENQDVFIKNI